ncbi:MAG: L-aspartate oxidase [Candidatus Zixiibacteriota bacterium]|jgi:L-aspartate oxidase
MDFDYLVVGSGLAGLYTALSFGDRGRVGLLTKRRLTDGATALAQGGIAAVTSPDDDVALHAQDTIRAGAGLCHEDVVDIVVSEGPGRVAKLAQLGVEFTREKDGRYELGMEGGHSRRRILHAADLTGKAIEDALIDTLSRRPNVDIFENHLALDLIIGTGRRCRGVYALNQDSGRILAFEGRATVLASGGAGKVYLITSNPDVCTGDGIAAAWRAGAAVTNMEFFQFHPTCLFRPGAKTLPERSFLLSEALRGEGGILLNNAGERFMPAYHPDAELAPRDVVARAIDEETKKAGTDHVFLDVTAMGREKLETRFPYIYAGCIEFGVDLAVEPAPVAPSAHYCCGGVLTDGRGRTEIPGLYAVGEVACTGLHGANRLASNSLLEAVVFAKRAADAAAEAAERTPESGTAPPWNGPGGNDLEPVAISHDWYLVRRTMRDFVGIVRNDRRLEMAAQRLAIIRQNVEEVFAAAKPNYDVVELRNIVTVAQLIVRSAQARPESRGLHFNADHPGRDDERWGHDTILQSDNIYSLKDD